MRVAAISLVVMFVSLAIPIKVLAADNENSLSFFRLAEKETYDENPFKYERGMVRSGNSVITEPIERQPAHVIPENAIESIVIKKIETSSRYLYLATFKLDPAEAEKLRVFLYENWGDQFHVRSGKQKIAWALFTAPLKVNAAFTNDAFTLVADTNLNSLQEIFTPFKNKVFFE